MKILSTETLQRTLQKKRLVRSHFTSVEKSAQNTTHSKPAQTVTIVKGTTEGGAAQGVDLLNKLGQSNSPNSNVNQFSNNSINQTFIIGQQVPVAPQETPSLVVPSTQSIQPSYTNLLPNSMGLNSFSNQTAQNMWIPQGTMIGLVPGPMGVSGANVPMMQPFMSASYQQQLAMQQAQMQTYQYAQSQAYFLSQQDLTTVAYYMNQISTTNPGFYPLVHQQLINVAQLTQNHELVDLLTSDPNTYRKKKFPRSGNRPDDQSPEMTPEALAVMFKFLSESGAGDSQQPYSQHGVSWYSPQKRE